MPARRAGFVFYTMAAQVKWELRRIPTCPHARAYYDDLGVDAHPALTGRAQHLARFSEPRILREPEQLRTCPVCRPVYAEVAIGASSRPRAPCAPPRNDSSPYRLTALPPYRLTALPPYRLTALSTRAISLATVRVAPRMTSPPRTATAGSRSTARSRPSRSDSAPMSGNATASPTRWMNSR